MSRIRSRRSSRRSGRSRTLFASAAASSIRHLHPENERLQRLHDEDRVVVSEPFAELPGVWEEIPESTALIVQPGPDERRPFRPRTPSTNGRHAPVALA